MKLRTANRLHSKDYNGLASDYLPTLFHSARGDVIVKMNKDIRKTAQTKAAKVICKLMKHADVLVIG